VVKYKPASLPITQQKKGLQYKNYARLLQLYWISSIILLVQLIRTGQIRSPSVVFVIEVIDGKGRMSPFTESRKEKCIHEFL